jgi:hypothetical protein
MRIRSSLLIFERKRKKTGQRTEVGGCLINSHLEPSSFLAVEGDPDDDIRQRVGAYHQLDT